VNQDTDTRSRARYHQLLRGQEPHRRLQQAANLSKATRTLALAGLRERHPDASPEELRARLTVRLYGRPAAERLLGRIPDDAV